MVLFLVSVGLTKKYFRVSTDLENLEKSRNLKQNCESQRICQKIPQNSQSQEKVTEFCCIKLIFSQFKNHNFENFLGEHASTSPVNGLELKVEFNPSLKKSWKSKEKWKP